MDARYRFIYADVGTNGRMSDGGVWEKCSLKRGIESGTIKLPGPAKLPGSEAILPHVFVADDAFPLTDNLLKPFPHRNQNNEQRVFSYRLSRARRTVENAFGILATKFRVFLTPINLAPDKVTQIVLCSLALHNFLLKENQHDVVHHLPDEGNINLDQHVQHPSDSRQHGSISARNVRNSFCNYFNTEGAVPWQNDVI